ncbi:phage tail length tape measure family protein [Methylocystis iwaonis]|uniref:Bacteriophage tail tape measure N-terminal domain-containing protein n=1 Tax=Methylocystis iwaonis TaxID=2885079 RepID=A0ABM8E7U9_9HYPH|nr:phage tail length tape measure family protein [Methylocystis iwaonis]BDV33917.1 hypothetical protein SS37A_14460 [Methylocystis iwaonis]
MTEIKDQITLQARSEGLDKVDADVSSLGKAEKDAATQAELLARAQTTVEKSLMRVQTRMTAYVNSIDPAEKALKKLEQGEALLGAARSKGLTSLDSMERAVETARERFQQLQTQSTGAAGALALTKNEALTLTYTFNDVVASLASGASPMTILMQQGGQVTQAFGGVRQTFEKLLPVLLRFAPIAAGAGVAAFAFKEVIGAYDELQKINESAGSAGVSTQLFQIWINYATKLRLTVEDAEKAILHAGQALSGQIDNFSALSLDNSQSRVAQRANNLSDVLGRDVASKNLAAEATTLDEMHRAALQLVSDYLAAANELEAHGRLLDANQARTEAINAATEVWGDAGRKIAEALRDGKMTADELQTASGEIGHVWNDEILTAQKQVNDELAAAKDHLSKSLTPASEDFARLSLQIMSSWAKTVDLIADAVSRATKLVTELRKAAEGTQAVRDGASVGKLIGKAGSGFGRLVPLGEESSDGHSLRDLTGEETPLPPSRPEGLGKSAPKAHSDDRARRAKTERDDLKSYLGDLQKTVDMLDAEANAQGKSNAEKQRAVDLAKAEEIAKQRGRPLTQAEIDQVTELADRHAALRAKIDETTKAQQAANEQSRFFADTAFSAIDRLTTGTAKLNDVVRSLAQSLAQAALKAGLLGEGPLASVFGTKSENGGVGGLLGGLTNSLTSGQSGGLGGLLSNALSGISNPFAGMFANGGQIPSGQWGIVGEQGPELAFGGAMGVNIAPSAATALMRAPSSVSNSRVTHNNVSVALHTPDAQSFMRNQGQVAAVLARAVATGSRNL